MTMIDRVVQAVRQNPEGLLVLGAGVALVLRSMSSSGQGGYAANSNYYSSSRGGFASEGPQGFEPNDGGLGQKIKAGVSSAQEAVGDAAESFGTTVSDFGQATTDGAKRLAGGARESVADLIETHPVAIGIAGLAAGCVAAAFIPASRLETETLAPLGKQAVDALSNAGQRVKDATLKAGEQLKDAATSGGLNAQGLSDVARNVANDFTDNVAGKAKPQASAPRGTSNAR